MITGIMSLKDSDDLLLVPKTNMSSNGGNLTSLLLTSLSGTNIVNRPCAQ